MLKKYSDLAASYERTKYSKDQLRYLIHLAYSNLENKELTPIFLFEKKLRKVLLDQYCLEKVTKVEKIFSKPPQIDLYLKKRVSERSYFKQIKGFSVDLSHFRFSQNMSLKNTKGYLEGEWWVQSLAASLPVTVSYTHLTLPTNREV